MQADDLILDQDLERGIGIFEDKDWVGKLLGQPILICTTLVGYMCDNCAKKVMCCELWKWIRVGNVINWDLE